MSDGEEGEQRQNDGNSQGTEKKQMTTEEGGEERQIQKRTSKHTNKSYSVSRFIMAVLPVPKLAHR